MTRVVATLNNDRTIRRTDFIPLDSDIVKNGTPDQRALLPAGHRLISLRRTLFTGPVSDS
jgi:hypothetical protein